MTCTIFGKVTKVFLDHIEVLDLRSKETHKNLYPKGNALLEIKEDTTAIFQGEYLNSKVMVDVINVRRFLDPLYEEDLFSKAGVFTLVAPINDPFPAAYKELLELTKQEEEKIDESDKNNPEVP